MEYQRIQPNQQTKPDRTPEQEFERLLMQYQGIFKHNIEEFAEKVVTKHRKKKNFSR